ncbi:TIGR02452 family protein [Chamaesiphon sp.]|uniref:TIGR02452 family protein n=1 Tax=Chamaesiphon sp. TaxID=2814140 RepID=UPI0035944C55
MNNRKQRAKIAQETIEILERGNYQNRLGETVDITEAITAAISGSIYYDSFYRVFSDLDLLVRDLPPLQTEFSVTNETTLHAASQLVKLDANRKILCLNFASAMSPGGGFLSGSQAQEESLARATAIYPCLSQMNQMYETNRQLNSPLFTNNMIYSPKVPVFRDDDDILLDKPFSISILTTPAVRVNAVVDPEEIKSIPQVMFERTEMLLSIAAIHGYKVLVLGAWGCGVFGNNPTQVATDFYHHLVKNSLLNRCFTKVVFAVLDSSTSVITPF